MGRGLATALFHAREPRLTPYMTGKDGTCGYEWQAI
jgi:hypothetical protein